MIGYILTCKEKHLYSLTCRTFALSLPYKSVSRHLNIFQSDPDFITSLVGWSVIIDYQLVISLFQQLMVTQLRIMEWHPSLTARQTVNVFVLAHISLPSPDDTKKRIMYRLTLHWIFYALCAILRDSDFRHGQALSPVGGGAEVKGAADELARKAVPFTSAP